MATGICADRRFLRVVDIDNQHFVHDSHLFLSVHLVGPRGVVPPGARRLGLRIHRHKYDYDESDVDVMVEAATGVAEAEGYEMEATGAAVLGGLLALVRAP